MSRSSLISVLSCCSTLMLVSPSAKACGGCGAAQCFLLHSECPFLGQCPFYFTMNFRAKSAKPSTALSKKLSTAMPIAT